MVKKKKKKKKEVSGKAQTLIAATTKRPAEASNETSKNIILFTANIDYYVFTSLKLDSF